MRVLIIGGTAFTGPHIVRELLTAGHEVTVFHRGGSANGLPEGVQHLYGDRWRLAENTDELRRLAPDIVLDMMLMTGAAARIVQEIFRGVARRLVVVSSMDVYRAYDILRGKDDGALEPNPLTEESALRPQRYPYREATPRADDNPRKWVDDYDKIDVEQVVMRDSALPGTVLRLPMIWGAYDAQNRLFPYLKRMDDGRPAILLSEGEASWVAPRGYVENVAHGIALTMLNDRAAGRIYNVADTEHPMEADWMRAIAATAGWDGRIVALPEENLPSALQNPGYRWAQNWLPDTRRIRDELGYTEPVTRVEGLARTIAWMRANPPESFDPALFDYAAEDAALAAEDAARAGG